MRKLCLCFVVAFLCASISMAQENLIINPGFEDVGAGNQPAGGWWPFEGRGKTSATVDHDVAHSGKASLRLQGDADAKFTFVSPKFEVAPGDDLHFEVWVRAQNLPPNQSTITAGLGFRHRDGRVIGRNYFHAEKVGANWVLISGDARAPAEAANAEVHLSYANGPGTVWYDDVKASITSPVAFALIQGAKPWPGTQRISVKVINRQANTFRGTVSSVVAKKSSSTPVEIPPHDSRTFEIPINLTGVGQHRYRLSLLDATGASLREAEGNFPTTAPLALFPACPCYQLAGQGDGATRVDARVNVDPTQRAGLKLTLEALDANNKSIQKTEVDASRGDFVGAGLKLPIAQPSTFTIAASLQDATGKELATDTTQVRVVASDDSKVTLGPDGFLRIGGQPNFPIGLYNCGHFEEMGQAGFSATHEYGIVTGGADEAINQNERQVQKLLDQSWSNGMRAMIELPRSAVEKAQWDQVRRRIETFRNHPGLLCWGSEERVARGLAPLANIAALYKLVHELDPNHPLVLGDTRDIVKNLQVDRRNFFPDPDMDVGIWWWYPIPLKEPDGNGLQGGANAGKLLEPPSWLTTTLSKKPLWIAIQSYQKPSRDARFPTPAEYRAQAYLSIIAGVKGLFFYVGSGGQKDYLGRPAGLLNKPVEGHWDYVQKLARELHEFSPVIMSSPASGEVKLSPANSHVIFTTRESAGKIYLIAASESPQTEQAHFESPLFEGRTPRVLYEDHSASIAGNSLSDTFEPFGVHIYELSKIN